MNREKLEKEEELSCDLISCDCVLVYCGRLETWNLARRLRKFFCLERATIVRVQGASEDKKFAA